MDGRISLGAACCAIAAAAPLPAFAQSGNTSYFNPAKLVSRGSATTPTTGPGTVVVQVLVNKDGTFKVERVIRSTNHGDDAAALEIAGKSKYRPATRGSEPQTAYYDFTLKFTGASGAAGTSPDTGGGSELDRLSRMISAGNYSGAQTGLKSYLAEHPDDQKAQLYLGATYAYQGQPLDATAAFDKAGTIPPNYTALAGKAYNDAAAAHLKANEDALAVDAAKRAVDLAPSFFTYNTLGFAEMSAGSNDAAIADLQKARALGQSNSAIKPSDRAREDGNLVAADLAAGKIDDAKAVAAESKQLDPSEAGSDSAFANYYIKTAQAAIAAGKHKDGAALYEQAAAYAPAQAAALYGQAAVAYLNAKPDPDNAKAKADADKALAADPDDAVANFAAGVALANTPGKTKEALVYLNKADASAKKANNVSLATSIESMIKQLGANK